MASAIARPTTRLLRGRIATQIKFRPSPRVFAPAIIRSFSASAPAPFRVVPPRFNLEPSKAPQKIRGQSKVFSSADEAVADIPSGATILSSGFGLCGAAETIIEAIGKRGGDSVKNLTAVSNNCGAGDLGLARLALNGQLDRAIISYLGNNKHLEKMYLNGDLSIELCPQGTLGERLRCGGAGIPAFYTPTAVGTGVEKGEVPVTWATDSNGKPYPIETNKPRETRVFNGKKYQMETALNGDYGICHAWKVDEAGNCVFRYTTKAFGTLVAKAARISIVEAEHIVPIGALDADEIDLPGIFIDRIVPATQPKHIELRRTRPAEDGNKPAAPKAASELSNRERIACRAAKELRNGYYVNLGVGMPTLTPSFLPSEVKVWIQSENGILGMGPYPTEEEVDPDIINAGKETVTLVPGASCFDSSESFGMIRGGHVDVSILGALQVSANGDLANFMIPGKVLKGMGGAMDLVSNPEKTKIVVITDHVAKDGSSKIVSECNLPLTGARVASTIITNLGVFQVDRVNGGLTLTELAEGVSLEEVKAKTAAPFKVASELKNMDA